MIGKTISHYKILEKLGEGGMGVVYKAEDTRLKRTVALKFLPQELTRDPEAKKRFIHEAQAASALDHPNVCTVYEVDETDDGQTFIAIACYEGETLKEKIARGPLKLDEAVSIAVQIAEGLQEAHERKIVHRDIKSANVMVTSKGQVKIMDFGLAKLAGRTKLTKTGTTLGTVAYMSPEQTRGEEVDHRTDIWSLGVMLYEMITGQLPFKGEYEQAVVYSITSEQPEPISGLRTGVPLELERIVNRMLAKDPKDRYQHADDLLSELNRLKKETRSKTIPLKPVIPKKKRKSIVLPAIILSIVALVIAGYLLLKPSHIEKRDLPVSEWENSIAVLPFTDLSPEKDQEYFCDGMTEQIISNLAKLPQLKVISRTSVMQYKDTNKSMLEIGKELNVEYILEGSIRKYGNRIRVTAQLIGTEDDFHVWTENYDRDYEELFDVQDDVSQAIATNLLSTLSTQEIAEMKTDRPRYMENYDRYILAHGFHEKFLVTQNRDYLDDAILLLEEILKQEPDYLSANVGLADAYNTCLSFNLAETEAEKSMYRKLQNKYIDIASDLNPKDPNVQFVKMMISIEEQELEYLSDIRLRKYQGYLKTYPNDYFSNLMVGIWLREYGLVQQSIFYLNKAVELNPLFTWNLSNRAWTNFTIGEFEKAELDFKKAFEIEPQDYGNVGSYIKFLISFRRVQEAETLFSQLQDNQPDYFQLGRLRAMLYAVKGDKEKALSSFGDITFDVTYGASFALAVLHLLLNDTEKAIELIIEGEKDYSSRGVRRSKYFEYLNLPYYKLLRDDSRFHVILAKHKALYEENLAKYGEIAR